jgi:hypothetical protein
MADRDILALFPKERLKVLFHSSPREAIKDLGPRGSVSRSKKNNSPILLDIESSTRVADILEPSVNSPHLSVSSIGSPGLSYPYLDVTDIFLFDEAIGVSSMLEKNDRDCPESVSHEVNKFCDRVSSKHLEELKLKQYPVDSTNQKYRSIDPEDKENESGRANDSVVSPDSKEVSPNCNGKANLSLIAPDLNRDTVASPLNPLPKGRILGGGPDTTTRSPLGLSMISPDYPPASTCSLSPGLQTSTSTCFTPPLACQVDKSLNYIE